MKNKYTIDELIALETKESLWESCFLGFSPWLYLRAGIIENEIPVKANHKISSVRNLLLSFLFFLKFKLFKKNVEVIYFMFDRKDVLDCYDEDSRNKKLFLNIEGDGAVDCDSTCDFLNVLRFMFRVFVPVIFFKQYFMMREKYKTYTSDASSIKAFMGDVVFLYTLKYWIGNTIEIRYTGAVIPLIEKQAGFLNSFEIQHGVIYPSHPNYIGIPSIKTGLIVYASYVKNILTKYSYSGNIIVEQFKVAHRIIDCQKNKYQVVIFTQPIESFSNKILELFHLLESSGVEVRIQKHPRDYFDYNIKDEMFVNSLHPLEVKFPILYSSTIIEDYMIHDKNVVIYDAQDESVNLDEYLNGYRDISSIASIVIFNNASDILDYICSYAKE